MFLGVYNGGAGGVTAAEAASRSRGGDGKVKGGEADTEDRRRLLRESGTYDPNSIDKMSRDEVQQALVALQGKRRDERESAPEAKRQDAKKAKKAKKEQDEQDEAGKERDRVAMRERVTAKEIHWRSYLNQRRKRKGKKGWGWTDVYVANGVSRGTAAANFLRRWLDEVGNSEMDDYECSVLDKWFTRLGAETSS